MRRGPILGDSAAPVPTERAVRMGVAYFVVAESEVAGFDPVAAVPDGKSVGRAAEVLDRLAAAVAVAPLTSFMSMSPEDAASFGGWEAPEDRDPDRPYPPEGVVEPPGPDQFPAEEWFDPADGLATVHALIRAIEADPASLTAQLGRRGYTPTPADVLDDLRDIAAALERLAAAGVRWHLGIDF